MYYRMYMSFQVRVLVYVTVYKTFVHVYAWILCISYLRAKFHLCVRSARNQPRHHTSSCPISVPRLSLSRSFFGSWSIASSLLKHSAKVMEQKMTKKTNQFLHFRPFLFWLFFSKLSLESMGWSCQWFTLIHSVLAFPPLWGFRLRRLLIDFFFVRFYYFCG